MIEYIKQRIANKKVLILGFGREGRSTLGVLLEAGSAKEIAVADIKEIDADKIDLGADAAEPDEKKADLTGITFYCGENYQDAIDDYELVMKSPGIVLKRPIDSYRAEIVSQMQLVFEHRRDRIVGITGTKGKSTTTTLLYHVLKEAGLPVVLAGNIGIPVFDTLHQLGEDSLLVLELSCHQLEYMTVSPKWGVLLNIYEEHLDHYGTMERYVASKEKIYVNQKPGDILYVHPSIAPRAGTHRGSCVLVEAAEAETGTAAASDRMTVLAAETGTEIPGVPRVVLSGTRISYGNRNFSVPTEKIRLLGAHNYLDIAFVYGICCDFGVDDETFREALISYVPLPHRLQFVGEVDGISYYDDSISTIDETTIQALNTIQNADTVLIGGMDRDISYVNLEQYLSSSPVAHIILMEATGKRIYQEIMEMPDFCGRERLYVAEHLEDAVALSKKLTAKGGSCILSPAAASYGIFKNFEERGDCFQRLVLETIRL